MNRYMVAGVLGLYVVHPSIHNASLNEELAIINFEIVPFQCRNQFRGYCRDTICRERKS